MGWLGGVILLSGPYPIYRAWRGAGGTPLSHAVAWSALAWSAWCAAAFLDGNFSVVYLALALTACSGVAVLGARRPGVAAWNLVVAGLLLLLCRPFLEGLGELRLEDAHRWSLVAGLAIGLGNYLPTRQAPTVVLLGAGCWLALTRREVFTWTALLAAAPWVGLLAGASRRGEDFDSLWRSYRDRFGFVWAQRLREQFNRVAANAGWDVVLGWSGLVATGEGEQPDPERTLAMLRALLKRFEPL